MQVDSIGREASTAAIGQQANVNLDDFLRIFLTQLNFQDPLEPVDNREFIAQLAQFSSLEISNRSNEKLSDMLQVVSVDQSLGLLGKEVELSGEFGQIIGKVTTVRFRDGSPFVSGLSVTGEPFVDVSPSSVSLVRTVEEKEEGQ